MSVFKDIMRVSCGYVSIFVAILCVSCGYVWINVGINADIHVVYECIRGYNAGIMSVCVGIMWISVDKCGYKHYV